MPAVVDDNRFQGGYIVNSKGEIIDFVGAGGTGNTPNGYQQITSLAASTALTVPANTTVATVVPEGQAVRLRKDGVAPTATVGLPIPVGAFVRLYGAEIAAARFIEQAAGAKLNVEYGR